MTRFFAALRRTTLPIVVNTTKPLRDYLTSRPPSLRAKGEFCREYSPSLLAHNTFNFRSLFSRREGGREVKSLLLLLALILTAFTLPASAQQRPAFTANYLTIAQDGATSATIIVAQDAGTWETQAALDLQKYIEKMSGAKPALASTPEAIAAALGATTPTLVVGQEAIKADPSLQSTLDKVAKKDPFLRADAIALRRRGNRVLLAGANDESHYYAVAHLLQSWGCRWYLPGELGEHVPRRRVLGIGQLEYSYAPPFEIRRAFVSRMDGLPEFDRRNFMSSAITSANMGSLHAYVKELIPEGKTVYEVPLTADTTAQHIAAQLEARYAEGVASIPIAPFTQEYSSDFAQDAEVKGGIINRYLGIPSSTDALLVLYNKIARILREKHPQSPTRLIGIAMASAFVPPQRAITPAPNLMIWMLPVNIDPIHTMNDERSPSRVEWAEIMQRWSQIMDGRIAIHDYEEAMLVWRDLPNPRYHVFQHDFKRYAAAGILGISPETRGSLAVNFLNIYVRAQLMWNPDADVDKMLAEFYPNFYGPAAKPMSEYGGVLWQAWKDTIVTEHEHFIAPAIYTPAVVSTLRRHIEAAEAVIRPLRAKSNLTGDEKLYVARFEMARLGFNVLDDYMSMVRAAATEADYVAASRRGLQGLQSELALAQFKPELMAPAQKKWKTLEPGGPVSQWPGEVAQYQNLAKLQNGEKGTLVAKLPLEWAFRRDPNDTGVVSGFAYKPVDLSFWNANKSKFTLETRKDYPTTRWEMLRTDLYMQAQGVLHPDWQNFTGHAWYRTEMELSETQAKEPLHLMFPGLFGESWLYLNGHLVAHRPQEPLWALNDYGFEWDVDIADHARRGKNVITLRVHSAMNNGGLFRRPFVYRPINGE